MAFAGAAAVKALSGGGPGQWLVLAAAGALWIGAGLVARAWIRRREGAPEAENDVG